MKLLTFPLTVKVEDGVSEDAVFTQLEDAIDPGSWNWEVKLEDCTSSVPEAISSGEWRERYSDYVSRIVAVESLDELQPGDVVIAHCAGIDGDDLLITVERGKAGK